MNNDLLIFSSLTCKNNYYRKKTRICDNCMNPCNTYLLKQREYAIFLVVFFPFVYLYFGLIVVFVSMLQNNCYTSKFLKKKKQKGVIRNLLIVFMPIFVLRCENLVVEKSRIFLFWWFPFSIFIEG